jgi:hypothetical protein
MKRYAVNLCKKVTAMALNAEYKNTIRGTFPNYLTAKFYLKKYYSYKI